MRKAVVQQNEFGCGVACVAFVAGISYVEAVNLLGIEQANSTGFLCKEIAAAFNKLGLSYKFKYLKPRLRRKIYQDGVIVFIKRSKCYPTGHYLNRHNGKKYKTMLEGIEVYVYNPKFPEYHRFPLSQIEESVSPDEELIENN